MQNDRKNDTEGEARDRTDYPAEALSSHGMGAHDMAASGKPLSQTKNFLILVHYFPPRTVGGAVVRTVKFSKYLRSHGWKPVMVIADQGRGLPEGYVQLQEAGNPPIYYVTNPLDVRPQDSELRRKTKMKMKALCGEILHYTNIDISYGMILPLIKTALNAIRDYEISLIYSTSPPHTQHFAGAVLKLITGLPLVLDFRDDWGGSPLFRAGWRSFYRYPIERFSIRSADRIVATTNAIADSIARRHRSQANRITVVTNGYDEADFGRRIPKWSYDRSRPLRILYLGSARGLGSERDLGPFIRAVSAMKDQSKIEFRLVGFYPPEVAEYAASRIRNFQSVGPVARESVADHYAWADVLLVVFQESQGGMTAVAGKFYEYLRAQRTILACVPPKSAMAELAAERHLGPIVDPENEEAITRALEELVEDPMRSYAEIEKNGDWYERFRRDKLASRLASVLDQVAGQRKN